METMKLCSEPCGIIILHKSFNRNQVKPLKIHLIYFGVLFFFLNPILEELPLHRREETKKGFPLL